MYATSSPAPQNQPDRVVMALQQARQQLTYLYQQFLRRDNSTAQKANFYGQYSTLEEALRWVDGIVSMNLPEDLAKLHLRTLSSFIRANINRERSDAAQQEHTQLNSDEWREMTSGKLKGYEFMLTLLVSLGLTPLR